MKNPFKDVPIDEGGEDGHHRGSSGEQIEEGKIAAQVHLTFKLGHENYCLNVRLKSGI